MSEKKLSGIKEIARIAGVSIGTVDRVLHNRGSVSPGTLKKINAAIIQINYQPNFIARSLVVNKMYHFAAVVPNPDGDEYWEQTLQGFKAALEDWNHFSITVDLYQFKLNNKNSFTRAANLALKSLPDGIVITPQFYKESIAFFDKCFKTAMPYVTFNTYMNEAKGLSFIGTDSHASGMVAADLLHMSIPSSGKIVVLHFDEDLQNSKHMLEKENGFREYFKNSEKKGPQIETIVLNNPTHNYPKELKKLAASNEVDGLFVSTSKAYEIASLVKSGKEKRLKIVGYDLLPKNIELMKKGTIDFLLNQNPLQQARTSISTLANHFIFKKKVAPLQFFPIEIISRYNLSSYLNIESDFLNEVIP
jgi:LacI family transcriptional regulator